MKILQWFLLVSTVVIYVITVLAILSSGFNWPAVLFGDLMSLNWRSQFDVDFLIHLFLLATWVSWREGFTTKGFIFGFLSIIMGGMFGFPYILIATYKSHGDPKKLLLGVHSEAEATGNINI